MEEERKIGVKYRSSLRGFFLQKMRRKIANPLQKMSGKNYNGAVGNKKKK